MPIHQYHNRAAGSGSGGLPLLGRLYKGDPKSDPKKPGQDRDFFRFEPEPHPVLTPERLRGAWENLYGKQPQVIRNVQFASDAVPQVFDEWMEAWGKSGNGTPLINRRCDGQTCFTHRLPDSTLNRQPQPCLCVNENKPPCRQSGRLLMFLPDLCASAGVLGLVMLTTHSTTDLDNIRGTLSMMHSTLGRLRNMAFILFRREEILTTPEGLPVKKWVVFLEADEVAAQRAALAAGDMLALPEGVTPVPPRQQAAPALPAPQHQSEPPPSHDDEPRGFNALPDIATDANRPIKLGTASQLIVKDGGKRSYALKMDNKATISLTGFDGLRNISPAWAAHVETWKSLTPDTYDITPVTVYRDSTGLLFEANDPTGA